MEYVISREAVSGSFESFSGFGFRAETNISKIKLPANLAHRSVSVTPRRRAANVAQALARPGVAVAARLRRRHVLHGTVMAAVLVVMLCSSNVPVHTAAIKLMPVAQSAYGVALDTTTAAAAAASVADKTNLIIASDATAQATQLASQVAIPTSDADTLAKRQVVATAGSPTRDILTYTVKGGDTLSGIASNFNITTDTLQWANNLSDVDSLKPGQQLVILPISGLLYTVQSGDTAAALADKYQSNSAQIVSYNNAEIKGLTPGSKIIIPDGVMPQAPKPAVVTPAAPATAARLTYYAFSGNGYAFGYCTWYVATRRNIPGNWGNANTWYYNAQATGFSVGTSPVPGAIAWTGAGYYGHVAYVESASGGMVTVSEMNYNGNWDRVTWRTVPASSFRYIY